MFPCLQLSSLFDHFAYSYTPFALFRLAGFRSHYCPWCSFEETGVMQSSRKALQDSGGSWLTTENEPISLLVN